MNLSLNFVEFIIFFKDLSIEIQDLLIQDTNVVIVGLQDIRIFHFLTTVLERTDLLVFLHDDVFDICMSGLYVGLLSLLKLLLQSL